MTVPHTPGTLHKPAELQAHDKVTVGVNRDTATVIGTFSAPLVGQETVLVCLMVPAETLFRLEP